MVATSVIPDGFNVIPGDPNVIPGLIRDPVFNASGIAYYWIPALYRHSSSDGAGMTEKGGRASVVILGLLKPRV